MLETPKSRRRGWFASVVAGVTCGLAVFAITGAAGVLSATPAQAAGLTSSAVTVTAKQQDPDVANAPMPDLSVTVSQTKDLVAQGIRVSWTGGKLSKLPGEEFGGENFLQIFMCWRDDPKNPSRPDRTTCEYGGKGTGGATRDAIRAVPLASIPEEDQEYTGLAPGNTPYTAIPFVARNGTRVDGIQTDPVTGVKTRNDRVILSENQFFTRATTNEIPWARSSRDGKGAVTFEVQTAVQSDGLGCGTPVEAAGTTTGASCWLVILPRGVADNGAQRTETSGLFIDSWRHALSVKLGFQPVGSLCPIGQAEQQVQGSELAALAVNAWQPAVCRQEGGSVYSLITGAESDAVLAAATTADAPLALTSRPLNAEGRDPLQYAPVALTGVSIAFAIDRSPRGNLSGQPPLPAEYVDAAGSPFKSINLTPRLLAKLLSYSYTLSRGSFADNSVLRGTHVPDITKDPDFLAVNDPEWSAQNFAQAIALSDIIVPQGRSDVARAVWAYIATDADARDFLASKPDPVSGMIVNPWYSTDPAINPTGTAFSLDRYDFPKADPVESARPGEGPINLITWRPYANDFSAVSSLVLRGETQTLSFWDVSNPTVPPQYRKAARSLPGEQKLIGLTGTAAASRYQLFTASLRNADDARTSSDAFVAPTGAGMLAAASVMSDVGAGGRVLGLDSASQAAKRTAGAYPLTLPVYAAANPAKIDPTLRGAYASLIRYAVSDAAQTPGVNPGQLPDGYAPLPEAWIDQSLAAAAAIERGPAPAPAETTAYIPTQNAAAPAANSSAGAAAPVAAAAAAPAPAAAGSPSASLSGGKTPGDPDTGAIAAAVPASILAGVLGAAAVPLTTRLRRRVI